MPISTRSLGFLMRAHQLLPGLQAGGPGPDIQDLHQAVVQTLLVEQQGNLVDVVHVLGGDHRLGLHVAEQGDLGLDVLAQEFFGAAQQDVGLDADGSAAP